MIPTLASHLVHSFEEVIPFIEDRIAKHWDLFAKNVHTQIRELLILPLRAVKSNGPATSYPPRLFVIDGLDECQNTSLQCELLRAISRAIPQIPYPVRFFVTSRPEAHITDVFDHDRDLQAIKVHRYNLSDDPDGDLDIRNYVEKEFEQIRRVHHLPHTWPDQGAIDSLVKRSSGNFAYASTVVRYIRSQKHHPVDLQEVIHLHASPWEGDRPNAEPDASQDQQDNAAVGSSVSEHDSVHELEGNSPHDHPQPPSTEVSTRTPNDGPGDPCKTKAKSPRQKALFVACRNGHEKIVKLLLSKNDVDMNSRDVDGQTALFEACREGHEAVVELLLSRNDVAVDATCTDWDLFGKYPGQTALFAASRRGYDGIVGLLLSRQDVDVNLQDDNGQTALFLACQDGLESTVKLLLSRNDVAINATVTHSDPWGTYPDQTPLMVASRCGYDGIVKLFLSCSDLDIGEDGQKAFFLASCLGHEGVVKQLLNRKDVDINLQDTNGQTALSEACREGYEAVVKVLLSRNDIAVNAIGTDWDLWGTYPGRTALLAAAFRGHHGIVKLLLSRNDVDIKLQDEGGQTALLLASSCGDEATVELLLSRDPT